MKRTSESELHERVRNSKKRSHCHLPGRQKDVFQGQATNGFFPNISRGAKVVKFVFSHSKIKKQLIFAEIVKIQGSFAPLPTPMAICSLEECKRVFNFCWRSKAGVTKLIAIAGHFVSYRWVSGPHNFLVILWNLLKMKKNCSSTETNNKRK